MSNLESKTVTLTRILHHEVGPWSASGIPFLIGKTVEGIVIKGEMSHPQLNETYTVWGQWEEDKKGRGHAFRFFHFQILIDTSIGGQIDYLVRYVPGIGRVRAEKLANMFGAQTLDVLRAEPEKVLAVPGIKPGVVDAIREHFEEQSSIDPHAYASLYDLFAECDPPPPRTLILKLLEDFGSSAVDIVREQPYLLLDYPRMGWATVDRFATQKLAYDRKGLPRFKAAVVEALTRISGDGDTYATEVDLILKVSELTGYRPPAEALEELIAEEIVTRDTLPGGRLVFALKYLYDAEREIAARLRILSEAARPFGVPIEPKGLEGEQNDAAQVLVENGVAILTGPPGVGKSVTLTRMLASLFDHAYWRTVIGAPTGKAAKRADELMKRALPGVEIPCSTIHKLLTIIPSGDSIGVPQSSAKFGRGRSEYTFNAGEDEPLEIDLGNLDECSMVDVELMCSFLRAVPLGCRLIFAGDHNQLPSVGPGSVLRDMMAGGIPTATLTKPRRNSGRIVTACHAIKDGRVPSPSPKFDPDAGENWFHVEEKDPVRMAQIIVQGHIDTEHDPLWDLQVISAQNAKLPIACAALNKLLSAALNPAASGATQERGGRPDDEESEDGPRFRPGDKIVRTKNGMVDLLTPAGSCGSGMDEDFDGEPLEEGFVWRDREYFVNRTPIVNGDIGQVLDITKFGRHTYVIVRFLHPDRLCALPIGDAHISLAYAITCHKAQGSGFPYVIVPVHESYHWNSRTGTGLWNRELIYTMFSRAEIGLVTVGTFSSIETAISRKTVHKRKTRLAEFIRAEFAGESRAETPSHAGVA